MQQWTTFPQIVKAFNVDVSNIRLFQKFADFTFYCYRFEDKKNFLMLYSYSCLHKFSFSHHSDCIQFCQLSSTITRKIIFLSSSLISHISFTSIWMSDWHTNILVHFSSSKMRSEVRKLLEQPDIYIKNLFDNFIVYFKAFNSRINCDKQRTRFYQSRCIQRRENSNPRS
jgi:hypothetical protein